MTYEEFKDLAKPFLPEGIYVRSDFKKLIGNDTFYSEISTGGMTGGNCWDNTEAYSYTSENKHEWDELDGFLETLTVSFMVYKRIMKRVRTDSTYQNEYYGNSTNYEINFIHLEDIYAELYK